MKFTALLQKISIQLLQVHTATADLVLEHLLQVLLFTPEFLFMVIFYLRILNKNTCASQMTTTHPAAMNRNY